jgi:hypothetical protein
MRGTHHELVERQKRLDWVRHYQVMVVQYRRDLQGWVMVVLMPG